MCERTPLQRVNRVWGSPPAGGPALAFFFAMQVTCRVALLDCVGAAAVVVLKVLPKKAVLRACMVTALPENASTMTPIFWAGGAPACVASPAALAASTAPWEKWGRFGRADFCTLSALRLMKLRIKAANGSRRWLLPVPSGCTLAELKAQVAEVLGSPSDAVSLSLNKRVGASCALRSSLVLQLG